MANDPMRPEYDFSKGVRGRHTARFETAEKLEAFIAAVQQNSAEAAADTRPFDIEHIKSALAAHNRYDRRVAQLIANKRYVDSIKKTVEDSVANLKAGSRSFVIYGEPQSGKTEMMIALTARLLDEGYRMIIVLLNDNVKLLDQNLTRFRSAGLDPSPKRYDEVLHNEISLTSGEWIIFSKKNASDLTKLIEKLRKVTDPIIVIDDEADFATPNAKAYKKKNDENNNEKTRINELVEKVFGPKGIYIGVTATPARLNLNRTYGNETERWVLFKEHPAYIGRTTFFPTKLEDINNLPFTLRKLPEQYDDPRFLREALFSFLINVAHLNSAVNSHEENYSMLIHTSGGRDDHKEDYRQVLKIFGALSNEADPKFAEYYKKIWEIAAARYPGEEETLTQYVLRNARRHDEVVMNSEQKKPGSDWDRATSPQTPSTIVIGGNIVSRGVTFNNLLSMFFTRDVKHKMQQDTYIQRARMFGDRQAYLPYFELAIPESLYQKWHRCFLFHTLALLAINTEARSPIWIEDKRISAVSSASIDWTTVNMDSGEMSFKLFDLDIHKVQAIIRQKKPSGEILQDLQAAVGEAALPTYLLTFIREYSPKGQRSLAIHAPHDISGYNDVPDQMSRPDVSRRKGFMGDSEMELTKYPDSEHHIKIFHYGRRARVFYKFNERVAFLKQK